MPKSRSDVARKVIIIRYAIFAFTVLTILGVALSGVLYIEDIDLGGADKSDNYTELQSPMPDDGRTITVREFFSYGCRHCKNLEPVLKIWKSDLAADVHFEKIALGMSGTWGALAQAYYTMTELDLPAEDHSRLFQGIHDDQRELFTIQSIADFIANEEVDAAEFLRVARSPAVTARLRSKQSLARQFQVTSVPTFVVAGKYVVLTSRTGGRGALKVVNQLIEQERTARAGADG